MTGFGLDHLPYGSVVGRAGRRFAAVRFGDDVLDLTHLDADLFGTGSLDAFLAAGLDVWTQVRAEVTDALTAERWPLVPLAEVVPVLAFTVADYVDFFTSEHHARNAGSILRPGSSGLSPNWKAQPIGYHGRSASVVVSGTPIVRPHGQFAGDGVEVRFGPCERLDYELEVAFVVGVAGARIAVEDADEHVFGVCLLNDWSARDIQSFEMAPLGPFLGKSFATSVSAWITPLAALVDARRPVVQDVPVLPHLRDSEHHSLALDVEVRINGTRVSRADVAAMYWTYAQMLTHLTSNGAVVRTGDLFASGTVSGPEPVNRGCLLELTWNGTEPLTLDDGSHRSWLQDGDEVVLSATAGAITLGDVRGQVVAT